MMNSWRQFRKISLLDNCLYGGPEIAEQVFEREDSFSADHPRRRQLRKSFLHLEPQELDAKSHSNVWYTQSFDEAKQEMTFEYFQEAGSADAS